jgi:hypothetical protein
MRSTRSGVFYQFGTGFRKIARIDVLPLERVRNQTDGQPNEPSADQPKNYRTDSFKADGDRVRCDDLHPYSFIPLWRSYRS